MSLTMVRKSMPDRFERLLLGPSRGDTFWWRLRLVTGATDTQTFRGIWEVTIMTARARNHALFEGAPDPYPRERKEAGDGE